MRAETRLRFPYPPPKRVEDNGLRTERQIFLYRKREAAKRERAERREAEARVRHFNFELIQRAVLLAVGVAIGIAIVVGAAGDRDVLQLALAAASAWAAIAAALHRWNRPKRRGRDT